MTYFFIDMPKIYDGWILQIYDPTLPFFRLTQQNYLSKHVVPKNKSLLCLEIKCTDHEEIWKKSDDEIISLLKSKLNAMKLVKSEKIEGHKIFRIKHLYPNEINPDDNSDDHKISKFIENYPNEYPIGIIQGDAGRLVNVPDEETSPGAGGIFNALSAANRLVNNIVKSK